MNNTTKNFHPNTTLVFLDAGVDNYQQLFDGVVAEAQPFVIDTGTDGIQQISQILQQYPGEKTVHIISHGSPGCLYLGNSQLSLDTLKDYAPQLQQWDMDNLLLYGCYVAAGDAGEEFVSKLRGLTGADIAASKTLTGAAIKGGNWDLEVNGGKVKVPTVLPTEIMITYSGVFSVELAVAKNIGGGSNDKGYGITTDSNNNVWVTGYYDGSIDIDSDGTNDLTSNGGQNSYVAKFDSNGNFLFAQSIGGSSSDYGRGIATDSNNNVWVTGFYYSSIDINSDGTNDLTSNGGTDSYVAKFDSNGDFISAQSIGGSSNDYGYDIAIDSNDNVWVIGDYYSSIDINSDGTNDLNGSGSYVAKFNSNGNFISAQNIRDSEGRGIAIDSNDNVWVTGFYQSGSRDINSDGISDLTSNGGFDTYAVKFNSNGDFISAETIGGTNYDFGNDIAIDSNDNVWLTGTYSSSIDIDSDGTNDLTSNGGYDSYVAKFNSNGNFISAQNIGGSSKEDGFGITIDSDDNVWATGFYESGSIDINSDGTNDLVSNGGQDSYVAKFDSNGDFISAETIGGSSIDSGEAIAADSNGNVWATGYYAGSIDIDSDGTNDLTSNGGFDSYVVKFSSNANVPPTITSSNTASIPENTTAAITVTATDDDGDSITYSISGGEDQALFAIDSLTGAVSFKSAPDFENPTDNGGDNNYLIEVTANDGTVDSTPQAITISVTDVLEGTPGNDRFRGTSAADNYLGLAGRDRIYGKAGADYLDGGDGNDIIYGGNDNDTLDGGLHHDRLYGGKGNDLLLGNDGNDILYGGAGDDTLNGGAGRDRYNGGAGADTFIIGPGLGLDRIQKFEDGTDTIQLEGIAFADLDIVRRGSSTLIRVTDTRESLAILSGINVGLVGADDFSEGSA